MNRSLCTVLLALMACSGGGGSGGRSADPDPAKPAPVGPGDAAAATAPAAPVALPPIELGCAADRDCALADLHLTGPETCCQGCNMAYAARADWVSRIRAACAARTDLTAHCLPLNCPVADQRAVCRDGRCTVAP